MKTRAGFTRVYLVYAVIIDNTDTGNVLHGVCCYRAIIIDTHVLCTVQGKVQGTVYCTRFRALYRLLIANWSLEGSISTTLSHTFRKVSTWKIDTYSSVEKERGEREGEKSREGEIERDDEEQGETE